MKKLLWFFAAPILISACKKDSDSTPTTGSSACLITEERDSADNKLTTSYEYDVSRRVSKINNFFGGQLRGYTTCAYSGNTIELKQFDGTGQETGTGTGVLNSKGFITFSKGSRQESNNGVPQIVQDSILITYNDAGQMLRYTGYYSTLNNGIVSKGDIRTTTYEYAGGRLVKENSSVVNWSNSTLFESRSATYTYDDNSPVVTSNPFLGQSGITLFGKPASDKIPVKAVSTYAYPVSGGSFTSTALFSATVDSKGNPTRIRVNDDASGTPVSSTYFYSYNCP